MCKPELLSLSDYLRRVHRLESHERKQRLEAAVFSGFVLHTKMETSRERKRTIAAVKETETPKNRI